MLKYFVWVVRDLASTGILFAAVFSLAKLLNINFQKKSFLVSSILGIIGALVLAIIKQNNLVRDKKLIVVKLVLIGIIILFSLIYAIFNWGLFSKKAPIVNGIITGISGGLFIISLMMYELPDVLLYPFHFLIKGQSVFSTDFLFKLIGFCFAVLLVFLCFLTLYKILSNLPLLAARLFETAAVVVNIIALYPYLLSPMIVRKWIRVSKALKKNVMLFMNKTLVFVFIMIGLALICAVILFYLSLKNKEPYSNPAEHRKIRAKCRNQRRWCIAFVLLFGLTIVDLTVFKAMSEKKVTLSAAESFDREGDIITIPIERVSDGLLHRFEYVTSDEVGIRFIIVQKNAFAFGIGFDACEICGATGYYQKNGQVICKLCDVIMNINTIGFKGGCNPIPLPYVIDNGVIKINIKDLEVEKRRFR